ncbi:MAG: cysteine desulfurase [Rhodospirillales bacterium]|nr:cysteine desulfurase [Rhodospirillales bacterium]
MDAERRPIYLDHMASTPLDPEVRAAMLPWLDAARAGNPHSEHAAGWRAAEAIEAARGDVAALIGARASEVVFTSGATEANNLALLGAGRWIGRVVVSPIEHPSVLEPAAALKDQGVALETVPVDQAGRVDLAALEGLLAQGPALVSIMAANNEIGTLQPLAEIGALCRAQGALFHSDAVQALTTQALDVEAACIDLLSLSGHKLYGPAGVGALYVRGGTALLPLVHGGGQQGNLRPGTLPVALCVALGAACRLARARRAEDAARAAALRERLFAALRDAVPGIRRNDPEAGGLPGCLNVTLAGVDAADLLLDLSDLAISTGSACSSLSGAPSHVLRAIGLSAEAAHASLRFGLGRGTTEKEIDKAAALLIAALQDRGRPG